MIEIVIKVGDLLDEAADALIATANPWLNMSGGVNAAILLRGGESIQQQLHAHLRSLGRPAVEPGTVVVTSARPLKAKQILHAVAIDPFYDSSVELIQQTVENALGVAKRLGAQSVAMPTLATGYGHLSIEQFAIGLAKALTADWLPIARLTVVVRTEENADTLRRVVLPDGRFGQHAE